MEQPQAQPSGILWRIYSGEAFSPAAAGQGPSGGALAPPAAKALPAFGSPSPWDERTRNATTLLTCPMAGFQFYKGASVWNALRLGTRLELRREPSNPHDRKAVAVLFQGNKLGYIPRYTNGRPAALMDQHCAIFATVAGKHEGCSPWEALQLEIWLEG